jgi:hypothetical protein
MHPGDLQAPSAQVSWTNASWLLIRRQYIVWARASPANKGRLVLRLRRTGRTRIIAESQRKEISHSPTVSRNSNEQNAYAYLGDTVFGLDKTHRVVGFQDVRRGVGGDHQNEVGVANRRGCGCVFQAWGRVADDDVRLRGLPICPRSQDQLQKPCCWFLERPSLLMETDLPA